jgi:hypothetical protein
VTALPLQTPAEHESPDVQALSSEQVLVSSFVYTQPLPGLHESSVHALPSSQATALPLQTPAEHESPDVHALSSEQVFVSSLS